MRIGSLFSGVGGFDLGLERAGHRVVWQVEYDKQARSVLQKHWPSVDLYQDVRHVDVGQEPTTDNGATNGDGTGGFNECGRSVLAPVDLICGGFPCQDLSVAGKRAGLDGDRSGLWFEFHRIVSLVVPTWVLIENVPGLLSSNGGRDFAVVLRGLADLGYWWAYRVLDSQYFGVGQRRRRVFVLACNDPRAPSPGDVLAIPEGMSGHPAPRREAGAGVAEGSAPGFDVAGTLEEDGTGRGTPIVTFDTTQITSPQNRNNPKPGDPCHPLAAQGHPPAITGTVPRRLTPTECERLQGFPDGWTAEGLKSDGTTVQLADSPRYRMMGNAVTVNVAEWLGRRLLGEGCR